MTRQGKKRHKTFLAQRNEYRLTSMVYARVSLYAKFCSKAKALAGINFAQWAIAVHSARAIVRCLSRTRLVNGQHRRRRQRCESPTPQPSPQSRHRLSRVNRNRARDRRRWEAYTLCIICFETTAIPTHCVPCCHQFIHEECLLQCFRHSPFHQG